MKRGVCSCGQRERKCSHNSPEGCLVVGGKCISISCELATLWPKDYNEMPHARREKRKVRIWKRDVKSWQVTCISHEKCSCLTLGPIQGHAIPTLSQLRAAASTHPNPSSPLEELEELLEHICEEPHEMMVFYTLHLPASRESRIMHWLPSLSPVQQLLLDPILFCG